MCKLTVTAGLCLILASLASSSASSLKLVCYYDSSAVRRNKDGRCTVSDIDPNICTHLIYAYSNINNKNKLSPNRATDIQRYQRFNSLKNRNPQLKTLLAVGGLNINAQRFSAMMETKQSRTMFIRSAITLLRENDFDGINLDWMDPGRAGKTQNRQRFTLLCKELKEAFVAEGTAANRDRLLLTASVSAEKAIIDACYEVAEIAKCLDFINVLTFDFHGPWESVTGHHSPLFQGSQDTGNQTYLNTDFAMQYWQDQGAPREKLNMGIAAYGRAFHLSSASSVVGAPANGPSREGCYTCAKGLWAYYEICLYVDDAKIRLITDQKVPYATTGNRWVGFDNKDSLDTKVSYIKVNNFGGAVVWSLDLDDFSGQFCKESNYPFISHLHTLLVPGFPNHRMTTPNTKTTLTTTRTPTTTTSEQPPDHCNGQLSGIFPNPDDPSTYYNCAHGIAYLQSCPEGQVFSPASLTCVTATTATSSDHCYGQLSGHFPNPNDPSTYYNCAHGIAYLQSCPEGQVFGTASLTCVIATTTPSSDHCNGQLSGHFPNPDDPSTYYNCAHGIAYLQSCPGGQVFGTASLTCVTATTTPSSDHCNGQLSGHFPNPNDPTTYYNCAHGIAYLQSCPEGQVFGTASLTCVTATTTPSSDHCNGQLSGHFPNPDDPSTYYNCAHGIAYLQSCPEGQVFGTASLTCVAVTTATPSDHCNGQLSGHFPNPDEPSTYYNCAHGIAYLQSCPEGQVFGTASLTCVTATTTPSSDHCNGQLSGHFPNPNDPSTYYNCAHGIAYLQSCPEGQVFGTASLTCVAVTTATPSDHCNGQLSGHFPNPDEPSTYYNCAHGIAYLQSCPEGQVFGTASLTCVIATTTPSSDHCNGQLSGHFPNPDDSSTYYNCAHGIAYLQSCPEGQVFGTASLTCVTVTTATPSDHCNGQLSGHFPNPDDPSTYYNCAHGIAYLQSCPEGQVFGTASLTCVTATTTPSSDHCNGQLSGHFPNPDDPSTYYNCAHGIAYLQNCPEGQVFSTVSLTCV
ncbi:probable endochitinase [Plectropomus leopardus]|uniref:probable endochitinase n=1 Tax=Plectropomus leopardus TaxID=160734 RepID=UPI001C4D163A|nr:probable endochitinase [Plectropomus leopardus]